MSAFLTIGEVAGRAGVRASAIRYYEEAGLLEEPERVGGKRRYDEEVLRRLALIGSAKRAGFTLGEIRTLLCGFPAGTGAAQRWLKPEGSWAGHTKTGWAPGAILRRVYKKRRQALNDRGYTCLRDSLTHVLRRTPS
jgi:DNA-binding transcriptional MerR regulator